MSDEEVMVRNFIWNSMIKQADLKLPSREVTVRMIQIPLVPETLAKKIWNIWTNERGFGGQNNENINFWIFHSDDDAMSHMILTISYLWSSLVCVL
jgi:hypothetical protein